MNYSFDTDIYEHGIAMEGNETPSSLRLLATTRLPIYSGFDLTIVDLHGKSLTERAVHVTNVVKAHSVADYYEESDLRYCVLATIYHLNRLANLYVESTKLFEHTYPKGTGIRGNTWKPSIFYEVDAFLGSGRRVYESIRKVLWKHYQNGNGGRWSSIRKVLTKPGNVPMPFVIKLTESWQAVGVKLTAYRDCVAHYEPLTNGLTTCWLDRYNGLWGATVKLPSNPDAQSHRSFDFESGPDALDYCHAVACHLVELCECLEAQPKIRGFLDRPPEK
jgi:hypothetical protein